MKKLVLTFEGCAPPVEPEDYDILSLTIEEVDEAIMESIVLVGSQVKPQISKKDYQIMGQVVSHLCTYIKCKLIKEGLNSYGTGS